MNSVLAVSAILLITSLISLFIMRYLYRDQRYKLSEKKVRAKIEIARAKEKVPTPSERDWIEQQWAHKREMYYLIIAFSLVLLGIGGITIAEAGADWVAHWLGSPCDCNAVSATLKSINTPWGKYAPGGACLAVGLLMLGHKTVVAIAKARKK